MIDYKARKIELERELATEREAVQKDGQLYRQLQAQIQRRALDIRSLEDRIKEVEYLAQQEAKKNGAAVSPAKAQKR